MTGDEIRLFRRVPPSLTGEREIARERELELSLSRSLCGRVHDEDKAGDKEGKRRS